MVAGESIMDAEWPYGGAMEKRKLGEGELVALEQALHNGTVVKKLVACQLLRKELEDRPVETAPVLDRPGILEGLCVAISSKDAPCYREASVVLKLFVLANDKAAFKIAGVPYLLHALCKLAVQQDDPDVISLLTTMARNHRVLWLVSNLTKIMRVHLLHEQHLLRDAFDAFHDCVLLCRLPELPREQPVHAVSVPQGVVGDIPDRANPPPQNASLPLERQTSHQEIPSPPRQRMCDVDDFLVDQSRSESMNRDRRGSASSIVVCDVEEWLPGAPPRNQLYASWSSPNTAHSDAHRRHVQPRKGSLQGPPSLQPPRLLQGQEELPIHSRHAPPAHPRPDASSQISEVQEILRQHIKSSQQQPSTEVPPVNVTINGEHRSHTPVVVYNGPHSSPPGVHGRAPEFYPPSSAPRIVSDVHGLQDFVPSSHPDQRGTMYVYELPRGSHGAHVPPFMAHMPRVNPLPRGWDLYQEPPVFGAAPAHHPKYMPQSQRAEQSVHMPGVSPSEYLRRSHQEQVMQSQLRGHDSASAYQSVNQAGHHSGGGPREVFPLQQFTVRVGDRVFRRESGDPENLCEVEEWLAKDAGLVPRPEYCSEGRSGEHAGWGRSHLGGYDAAADAGGNSYSHGGGNSSDDDEWV